MADGPAGAGPTVLRMMLGPPAAGPTRKAGLTSRQSARRPDMTFTHNGMRAADLAASGYLLP
jgi:hypothetical protein